jgi:hypothetical protein
LGVRAKSAKVVMAVERAGKCARGSKGSKVTLPVVALDDRASCRVLTLRAWVASLPAQLGTENFAPEGPTMVRLYMGTGGGVSAPG